MMGSLFFIELVIIVSSLLLLVVVVDISSCLAEEIPFRSVLGDPGMKKADSRFLLEAWNSCNEVGFDEVPTGSPRMADCTDLLCNNTDTPSNICEAVHKVKETDNRLKAGDKFPSGNYTSSSSTRPDEYVVEKERYLGSLCEVVDSSDGSSWSFWTIMLKNGNLDKNTTLCPENGKPLVGKTETNRTFPCFGTGCMNPPLMYQNESKADVANGSLVGGFYGTYDLDADSSAGVRDDISFFSATWSKNSSTNSWIVSHKLRTSKKYPWLMLYLRADAATGFNGGYHYDGRGMMKKLPQSPNFKVKLTLDIKQGGGKSSQFYLLDIGSCWKNNGKPCDGDVLTDVTRYSEMIINPSTGNVCAPDRLASCPLYHINSTTGEIIYRNDTSRFPYTAYHLYCGPGNVEHLDEQYDTCDPYSNPQAQELLQLLPHPEWAVYGYPGKKGDGWESGPTTWELDTGKLSDRLYFYQDPGTQRTRRVWTSINVGTEMYFSQPGDTAEWSVSDFDVLSI